MFAKTRGLFLAGLTGLLSMFFGVAHAAGPDLSSLTSSIDFSTVVVAILAVASALAVVYIAWKGAGMVIAALRRL